MLKARKKISKKELKQDPFIEQMDGIVRFYKTHQKTIYIILVSIIVLAAIITGGVKLSEQRENRAQTQLSKADFYLKTGQNDLAVTLLTEMTDGMYGKRFAPDAAYKLGIYYLSVKKYDDAESNLKIYLKKRRAEDALMTSAALAGLAASAEAKGDHLTAGEHYRDAADFAPFGASALNYALSAAENFKVAGETDKALNVLEDAGSETLDEAQKTRLETAKVLIED